MCVCVCFQLCQVITFTAFSNTQESFFSRCPVDGSIKLQFSQGCALGSAEQNQLINFEFLIQILSWASKPSPTQLTNIASPNFLCISQWAFRVKTVIAKSKEKENKCTSYILDGSYIIWRAVKRTFMSLHIPFLPFMGKTLRAKVLHADYSVTRIDVKGSYMPVREQGPQTSESCLTSQHRIQRLTHLPCSIPQNNKSPGVCFPGSIGVTSSLFPHSRLF